MMVAPALLSSATDLWSTPQWLFDKLNDEFHFDLDVCALPTNTKCDRFFASYDALASGDQYGQGIPYPAGFDGLKQSWAGRTCWMNPPYGREIGKWVEKAHRSVLLEGDPALTVVCLLPARTDTRWWWEYCQYGQVRFLPGRLKFGGSKNSAPFPSALVIFDLLLPSSVRWWDVREGGKIFA